MPELLSPQTTHSIFWFFTSAWVPFEDPLALAVVVLLLLLLTVVECLYSVFCECPFGVFWELRFRPGVDVWCNCPNSHLVCGVWCNEDNSCFVCGVWDNIGAPNVVISSLVPDTDDKWLDKPLSRQPDGGGGTNAILLGNPNSNGLNSDPCVRGLKNPVAVDGEGHNTPPPYTLKELWVIILPVLAPQSGPTLSRKILNLSKTER